jgi:hypothetical protein
MLLQKQDNNSIKVPNLRYKPTQQFFSLLRKPKQKKAADRSSAIL